MWRKYRAENWVSDRGSSSNFLRHASIYRNLSIVAMGLGWHTFNWAKKKIMFDFSSSKSTSGIYICMLSCKYKYYMHACILPLMWYDKCNFFHYQKIFLKKLLPKFLKNNTTTHVSRYIMLYIRLYYTEYNLFMCMHYNISKYEYQSAFL